MSGLKNGISSLKLTRETEIRAQLSLLRRPIGNMTHIDGNEIPITYRKSSSGK
jgi:hypothetical protein